MSLGSVAYKAGMALFVGVDHYLISLCSQKSHEYFEAFAYDGCGFARGVASFLDTDGKRQIRLQIAYGFQEIDALHGAVAVETEEMVGADGKTCFPGRLEIADKTLVAE